MMTHVIETCRVACMERWIRAQNTSSCINNSASSSSSSVEQCAWYEAPVTRTSRQLYRPVHRLARHWVLTGRQFNLSHIADVLVDNATELLVSTRSCCSRCLNILVLINCSDQTRPAWLTVPGHNNQCLDVQGEHKKVAPLRLLSIFQQCVKIFA